VANALDLDLACFGGAGGQLGGIDVGRTTPDPNAGGGGTGGTGGGGGTGGTGGRALEGGLGCSVSATSSAASSLALFALFVAALVVRRYFSSSR
jgi:MYXO-CTERM domain-containing protein